MSRNATPDGLGPKGHAAAGKPARRQGWSIAGAPVISGRGPATQCRCTPREALIRNYAGASPSTQADGLGVEDLARRADANHTRGVRETEPRLPSARRPTDRVGCRTLAAQTPQPPGQAQNQWLLTRSRLKGPGFTPFAHEMHNPGQGQPAAAHAMQDGIRKPRLPMEASGFSITSGRGSSSLRGGRVTVTRTCGELTVKTLRRLSITAVCGAASAPKQPSTTQVGIAPELG